MSSKDPLGLALSGADPISLPHYENALGQFQCYVGDPLASVDAALAASPDFLMAHLLKAYLHLLGTEPSGLAVARACHASAAALPSGSCAAVSIDRHEPRLVQRMPIDS